MLTQILLACVMLQALPPAQWLTDFDAANAQAIKEQKYILLNFSGSDWCVPCIKMKKEILTDETFLAFAQDKLVLVNADFPRSKKNRLTELLKAQNAQLAERYNTKGVYPFTVLLDTKGRVLKSWEGKPKADAQRFAEEIAKALEH